MIEKHFLPTNKRLTMIAFLLFGGGACLFATFLGAQDKKAPTKSEKATADDSSKTDRKKTTHTEFMRKKLSAAQDVIEGLALEDFEKIEAGGKQLQASSAAAEFRVINDKVYAEFSDDFHRTAGKLVKAAREKRLEGATLAFMDLTMNCVDCHKFSRGVLVAK